jgi:hypothetical protein
MMLKQTHIETKVYFLEDDKILFTIEDGKYTTDVVNFLKKQADVIQARPERAALIALPPFPHWQRTCTEPTRLRIATADRGEPAQAAARTPQGKVRRCGGSAVLSLQQ